MARRTFISIPVLALLALAGAALAAEAPVAVSPGHASKLARVEARCPTFSWGEVEGAKSYELVVYRVGERGEQAEPLLRQSFPGSVESWTPSLDSCLERGGQYAWSVRAVGGRDASEWSSPSLFDVAPGPSEAEFEEAVAVVRSSTLVMPVAGVDSPSRLSVGTGDSALQVNGSPVVTVATLEAGCLGRRFLDQGDGTVLDCNTRLIWLKHASCFGTGTWGDDSTAGTVQKIVADFNSGGVSYGCGDYVQGTHTDWRVPKMVELCSAGAGFFRCPLANYATSLVDSRFADGSPKVSNADGDGRWEHDDPFVGVQSAFYWSATTYSSGSAWSVRIHVGDLQPAPMTQTYYVWPVRDGQ
jgi:hypothetical protein